MERRLGLCEGTREKYRKQTRKDRVSRNTRPGGLANLHGDPTACLGGREECKRRGRQCFGLVGGQLASGIAPLKPREVALLKRGVCIQVGVSENDLTVGEGTLSEK